jgi:hypothetical protein
MESKTIDGVLTYLCEELGGDWFLTGGTLVRLNFDASRGTEDIDLVRIRHQTLSDDVAKDRLFQWLIARGLGPEWVNSAVEPFVREVPDWEKNVILLRSGSRGNIFRPNLTLFVYLKIRRGTEVDITDISKAVAACSEGFDEKLFRSWSSSAVANRFEKYRQRLGL